MTVAAAEATFRRLTIGEPGLITALADRDGRGRDLRRLDPRTASLLQVGALIGLDAPETAYRTAVDDALRLGVDIEDLLAALLAVAEQVGYARVIGAAPRIALAAGYDVEADLDRHEPADPGYGRRAEVPLAAAPSGPPPDLREAGPRA
jgi:alkylhydroperoxidase/carboxymuconolactone decarboxylase family protein YurZ